MENSKLSYPWKKEKKLFRDSPPGGILADEMGLGKTVEVLACMLNNPRRQVEKPEYLEPIHVKKKKKRRSRKCRSPSPIEFHLSENPETNRLNSDILKPVGERSAGETSDEIAECAYPPGDASIPQMDGGDTDPSSASDEFVDDANDSDFVPESQPSLSRRQDKSVRRARKSLSRKFSEKRTVYYHEEFDSQSSDYDDVPLASRKKRSVSRKKSIEPPKKKAKTINTSVPVSDKEYPLFEPFKNGLVPGKDSKSIHDLLVKSLVDLRDDLKNRKV